MGYQFYNSDERNMFVSHNVTFLEKEFLMDCGDYRKIELDEVNLNIDEPMMEFYFSNE